MWYVYVLFSEKTGKRYTGMSEDIERRLEEHNAGLTRSTKTGCPWRVIYSEQIGQRKSAREREKYLKSGIGREYLDKLTSKQTENL